MGELFQLADFVLKVVLELELSVVVGVVEVMVQEQPSVLVLERL